MELNSKIVPTLAKRIFTQYEYKNLENPDQKLLANEDPKRFLQLKSKKKMILDEIQEAPELTSYIQTEVDQNQIMGQFVLTGSQNLKLSETISQSLAGRVANFELLPLSFKELLSKYPPKTSILICSRGVIQANINRKLEE